jgi:hypothetical protein
VFREVPLAPPFAPQTPLLLVGLFLLGFLPACASLLGPSPDAGAGVLSNLDAICTVTNPQGTVAQRSVTQVGTEETWFGAQVPTGQVVGREECPIPAGEQVKIVGLGTATREVVGLGEPHCYGAVPTADLGHCRGARGSSRGRGLGPGGSGTERTQRQSTTG